MRKFCQGQVIDTAFRFFGTIGSVFILLQSIVWCLLCFSAAICKYTACGSAANEGTFEYCFYITYYYDATNKTGNSTRLNYLNPEAFHGLMWFAFLMYVINSVISAFTAIAFIEWDDPLFIKKATSIWTTCVLVTTVLELLFAIIFLCDIITIARHKDAKCFLENELSTYLSSDSVVRSPAPYLLQLQSNLGTLHKKINKLKRNLHILDAVFDENSPDHIKNPFISKNQVYVEDIWTDMFNNSIREKKRRNSEMIPFDEIMRNFVTTEDLNLDEIDYDILKNFDGLTNNKWVKPIESSSMAFGKDFNLSSSITEDNSAELEKIGTLLYEFFKEFQKQNLTNCEVNENFRLHLKTLLNEFKPEEKHFVTEQVTTEDRRDVLLTLKNFFEMLTPVQKASKETPHLKSELDGKKINISRPVSSNNSKRKKSHISRTGKPRVKFAQRDMPIDDSLRSSNRLIKRIATDQVNEYLIEICDNCAFFPLSASIFCMIMSIKTGLLWIFNIIITSLVLLYTEKGDIQSNTSRRNSQA